MVQGDLGFIFIKTKRIGSFFVGVQTHTKIVFCTPLKKMSSPSVIAAIALMLKVGKRTTHNAAILQTQYKIFV